jgi:hypothetical protein
MPPLTLTALSTSVRISYDSLQKYLQDFAVSTDRINVHEAHALPVEIRMAEFSLTNDLRKRYQLVFVFDKERHNRLLLLNHEIVDEVVLHLQTVGLADSHTVLILVGKEGSKDRTAMVSIFNLYSIRKVKIVDFDGKTALVDFIRTVASDIDRVEVRNQSLQDPVRLDLTSHPTSEKRIKIVDDMHKQRIVFANQLIQVPGITEKVALGIADYFEVPAKLMRVTQTPGSLDCVRISNARGEEKALNSRIRAGLLKVYDFEADPNDSVW